jgi:hypothetical protein
MLIRWVAKILGDVAGTRLYAISRCPAAVNHSCGRHKNRFPRAERRLWLVVGEADEEHAAESRLVRSSSHRAFQRKLLEDGVPLATVLQGHACAGNAPPWVFQNRHAGTATTIYLEFLPLLGGPSSAAA